MPVFSVHSSGTHTQYCFGPNLISEARAQPGEGNHLRLCADGTGPVEPDPAGAFLDVKIDSLGRSNPT